MGVWGTDGWVVKTGEGDRVDATPRSLEVLVRGADVDGALGAFVFTHTPMTEAIPHAHLGFAKVFYVLEGHYDVRVGDATFSAESGALVVVPKASYHAFTTTTGGRVLFVCAPSGNEEMFLEMGKLGADATEEQLAEVADRFGMVGLPDAEAAAWRPEMPRLADSP